MPIFMDRHDVSETVTAENNSSDTPGRFKSPGRVWMQGTDVLV